MTNRYVAAAACLDADNNVYWLPPPNRHNNVLWLMHDLDVEFGQNIGTSQGFVDNNGQYLTREEAAILAVEAGQIKETQWGDRLYSEDLW